MRDKTLISNREKQKGFSLLELLVAFVVLAIMMALVYGSFNNSKNQLQRQSLALQLKNSLERARFDAVKRRATSATGFSSVVINQNSFTLNLDTDMDGTLEMPAESQTYNFDSDVAGRIVNSLEYPVTINFDRLGHSDAFDKNNNPVSPNFTLCTSNCTGNSFNSTNATIISVSNTGTVSMLSGGSSQSSVTNPTWVSNVNSNSGINQTVTVNSNYGY